VPLRVCSFLLALCLLACSRPSTSSTERLEWPALRYEGSPGTVTLAELAEDLGLLAPLRLDFVGNNMTGGPHSIQSVLTGDLDVGGSFNGAIVKLVASKAPLTSIMAAYGTDELSFMGFYTLQEAEIRNARDFIGKKVAINTLGAHAEFALREYLARGGLDADELHKVTMIALPSSSIEHGLRSRQIDVACMSTIFRDKALARGGIRLLFSDYQLFGKFNAGSTVMSNRFIAEHPKAVSKYVEGVGEAIEWTRSRPREEVIARMESIIAKRQRHEDTSIVKYWTSSTVATPGGALLDEDFQIWIDWLVRDGQLAPGQITPQNIYTNQFQPPALADSRPGPLPR
jgi:ABC-type nitrate/sulfonate/bicarbonate transport system substrate-binding protein